MTTVVLVLELVAMQGALLSDGHNLNNRRAVRPVQYDIEDNRNEVKIQCNSVPVVCNPKRQAPVNPPPTIILSSQHHLFQFSLLPSSRKRSICTHSGSPITSPALVRTAQHSHRLVLRS
jgi:hypothetical protein